MSLPELLDLVRRMRTAQRKYYKLHPVNDRQAKTEALIESKQLEREVDIALVAETAGRLADHQPRPIPPPAP